MRHATSRLISAFLAAWALLAVVNPTEAGVVYGVQSGTGLIVTVDPGTGSVLNSYAAPGGLGASNTLVGLTSAQNDTALLYINSGVSSSTMYRINPVTGAVLSTYNIQSWPTNGLSYSNISGTERVYRAHGSPTGDMHLQTPLGGGDSFFFTPGTTAGGVGGDGHGRQFGIYADGLIHEFNQTTGAFLGAGFANPTGGVGLAYDGTNLYVSTNAGRLLTLNPNTGAVLNNVAVGGGTLWEIGASPAAVPAPPAFVLAGLGIATLAGYRRLRRR